MLENRLPYLLKFDFLLNLVGFLSIYGDISEATGDTGGRSRPFIGDYTLLVDFPALFTN